MVTDRLFYLKLPGPEVEFFNPKLRHELEKKDAEIMAKTKLKGAAPGELNNIGMVF